MENAKKTNNFLEAIEKYAQQQKQQMASEFEVFKAAELKKAEEEGLKEAYNIIQNEIAAKKSEITSQLARREQESRLNLFSRRKEMTDEIFSQVKEKIIGYTKTDKYKEKLLSFAKEVKNAVNGNSCVLYLRSDDMKYSDELLSVFDGKASAEEADDILLGGLRCYCEEMSMIFDETFDSRLEAQVQWFTENSTLKVV